MWKFLKIWNTNKNRKHSILDDSKNVSRFKMQLNPWLIIQQSLNIQNKLMEVRAILLIINSQYFL